jgi:hypothetical protein
MNGAAPTTARRQQLRRLRRHVPQLEGVLERREVLSPFPFIGTFSGTYSANAEYKGIVPGQPVSGTITITIAADSIQNLGDGVYNAYLTGTISFTGFLGQSGTFPYSQDYTQDTLIESGYASTGIEPTVDIQVQAYYPMGSTNNVFIEGYCTNNSIVASCDIDINNYFTAVPANVVLGAQQTAPSPTPAPGPAEVVGATVVRPKHAAAQIVVQFSGTVNGGSGLPLSDFRLAANIKGKEHVKAIHLAGATYDLDTDAIILSVRRKLTVKTPLRLTISGLAENPLTLVLAAHEPPFRFPSQ